MVNCLPSDKILSWTKLKTFADDKFLAANMIFFFPFRVENIVGKGQNAGYQHFLLFPQCFQKVSSLESLKARIEWEGVNEAMID